MTGEGPPEHPEPTWVIGRPVNMLERHTDDVGGQCARTTPQQLFATVRPEKSSGSR
jgi:hypothetical protein